MAQIYPKDIEILEPMDSEAHAYNELSKLPDDYIVIYSVPWLNRNPATNRFIQGESDFIVIKKNVGFICIEVKGGIGIECNGQEWNLILKQRPQGEGRYISSQDGQTYERRLKRSPYQQARESMYYFKQYFKDYYEKEYQGVFGYGVMFPNYEVETSDLNDADPDITLDPRDFDSLEEKIEKIFNSFAAKASRTSSQDAGFLADLLLKQRLYGVLTSDFVRIGTRFYKEISQIQDYIINFLSDTKIASINGPAGTGKTYLGIKKASLDASIGKNVLYVCFNSFLANFVRNDKTVKYASFDTFNFHMFIQYVLGKDKYKDCVGNLGLDLSGILKFLDNSAIRFNKYDEILIDEAQDFHKEWLDVLSGKFLENDGGLYLLYDNEQDIFSRGLNDFLHENKIQKFSLSRNLRNTREIHSYFIERTSLGGTADFNKLSGEKPEAFEFQNVATLVSDLKSLLEKLIVNNKVNPSKVLLLSTREKSKSWLQNEVRAAGYPIQIIDASNYGKVKDVIPFTTVQAFKGLEADVVIFLNESLYEGHEAKNLEYVAMSRARFFLFEYRLVTN